MANRLEKHTELVYIPGVEGRPAVPARCVTSTYIERNPALTPTAPLKPTTPGSSPGYEAVYLGSQSIRTSEGSVGSAGSGQGSSTSGGSVDYGGGGDPQFVMVLYGGSSGGTGRTNNNYQRAYTTTTSTTCYPGTPAIPGRPARTLINAIVGWNGGANSRRSISGDNSHYMRWRVSHSPVGVVVGMVSANITNDFAEVEHGFYVRKRTAVSLPGVDISETLVDIVERGVTVASVPDVDLTEDPYFYIFRSAEGEVTYSIPSIGYSLVSTQPSFGRKVMDATLYASGDYVTHPSLGDYVSVDTLRTDPHVPALATRLGVEGRVHRVRLTTSDGRTEEFGSQPGVAYVRVPMGISTRALASINGEFLITARFRIGVRGAAYARGVYSSRAVARLGIRAKALFTRGLANQRASIPSVQSIGSDELGYAAGRIVLPSIQAAATEPTIGVTYSLHDAPIPSLLSLGVAYAGAYITGDTSLPSMMAIGSDEHGYGAGRATMPPLYSFGEIGYSKPGEIGWLRYLLFHDLWARTPRIYADITDALQLSGTEWALTVSIAAEWADALDLDDQWTLYRILFRYLQDKLRLRSTLDDTERDLIQYALNLDTGGVSRYTGYEFDGFATAGQVTYGWNKQGVYALGDDTDDGVPIDAQVDFGRLMHSDLKAKHIEGLFLGIHTDGQVYVRFRSPADGVERVYRARQRRDSSRVNVGRGLTARRWDFILEVVNASEVEVDSIEFIPGVSSRRWVK